MKSDCWFVITFKEGWLFCDHKKDRDRVFCPSNPRNVPHMKKAVKFSRFQHFMDYISVTKACLFNGLRNEISTNQQKKHEEVSCHPPARAGAPIHDVRVCTSTQKWFFKPQLLRVYVSMYYHILLQTCNICNILQVIASRGIDRGAFLRITA